MKGSFISVFVPFFLLHVCVARVFDEKSEAIKEIEKKFNEAMTLRNSTLLSSENEKTQINNKGEDDLKKYLNSKIQEAKTQLEIDASAVIRTAIVKAKPVSVIYCIRKVVYSGNQEIVSVSNENLGKVLQVKINKLEKIDFDIYALKAISAGLRELVDQAKKKITEESGMIQAIKIEALKRCDSAILLLGEIEVCLHEPILAREYIKTRQAIDKSIRDLKVKLLTDLETCLK